MDSKKEPWRTTLKADRNIGYVKLKNRQNPLKGFMFGLFSLFFIMEVSAEDRLQIYHQIPKVQAFQNWAIQKMKDHERGILGQPDRGFNAVHFNSIQNDEGGDQVSCQNFFRAFKDKQTIKISIFLGYMNEKEFVADPLLASTVERYLNSPCLPTERSFVCGFSKIAADQSRYSKNVTWTDQTRRMIEVDLHFPALTILDKKNRKLLSAQNKNSEFVRQSFISALKTSDVVIYDGHGRYGGGPDFFPEKMLNRIDSDDKFYKKNLGGVHDLVNALNARTDGPLPFLLLNSCMSEQHIHGFLQKSQNPPLMAIVNNSLTNARSGFPIYPEVLNIFLRGQCPFDTPLVPHFLLKKYVH
ncbi:MAG: hypothetical protein JNM39_06585 [Bdellovibrionaceae bacterium]|nr:hypothetical protein [Pseudobdellovibrionaceae bacterium]